MKIQLLKYCSALFVIAVSLGLGQKNQALGQCISFNGPLTSFVYTYPNYDPNNPNSTDAFANTLVLDANEPLPMGTYLTWCGDVNTDIHPGHTPPGTQYTGTLYPSCDPNFVNDLPAGLPSAWYITPAVWRQINYVLNNKNGNNYLDIQAAIWTLLSEQVPTSGFSGVTQGNVDSLVNAAKAITTWVPQCGNVIAAAYVITNQAGTALTQPVQLLILEVPYVCLSCPATTCSIGGTPYSSALVATAKTPPYTFSIVSGSLPPGLTLNPATGAITGIPTAAGTFPFTAQVMDSTTTPSPQSATVSCSITIVPPLTVTCPAITIGQVGVPQPSSRFTASGGSGSYKYFIAVGNLPGGLTLDSTTGVISGTPTNSGTFSFTVGVTDGSPCNSVLAPCSIKVNPCQTSVCGFVFVDCDGDGFLTPGLDYGMTNVIVILKNSKNVAVATNRTDSQGSYCFYNLPAGTYTVCINQPTNNIQSAGTHCNHWLNNSYQQCWNENDGYQHWKGGDGVDCWKANDGYKHWKNSNGQDCWNDKYGWSHTQACNYVSCDVPKGNCETFTLAACQALTNVSFAYQGILVKPVVCVTGPSKGICGKTGTYTCYVTNAGTACIPTCQVSVCGKTYNCPPLSPGQGCSFTFNYQFQYSDYGKFNCQATATCTSSGNSNNSNNWSSWWSSWNNWGSWGSWGSSNNSNSSGSYTAQGNCYTSVGYW